MPQPKLTEWPACRWRCRSVSALTKRRVLCCRKCCGVHTFFQRLVRVVVGNSIWFLLLFVVISAVVVAVSATVIVTVDTILCCCCFCYDYYRHGCVVVTFIVVVVIIAFVIYCIVGDCAHAMPFVLTFWLTHLCCRTLPFRLLLASHTGRSRPYY